MEERSAQSSDLAFADEMMCTALRVMDEFPSDFVPFDAAPMPRSKANQSQGMHVEGIGELLADSKVVAWLESVIDSWPEDLLSVFVQCSSSIAQILGGFGVRGGRERIGLFPAGVPDQETVALMMALAQLNREIESVKRESGEASNKDPMGMQRAMVAEIRRRGIAYRTPFARTLTTLLGDDALLWLTSESRDGYGKIQPHEFSRSGWRNLSSIENQVAIEQELLRLEPEAEYIGRIVVALSWTLAALASFINPAIFLGEREPYLSSMRDGGYTISFGEGTRTLLVFEPAAMRTLVRILVKAVQNPLMKPADLMWMGAGLASVRKIKSGLGQEVTGVDERFSLFLSHRGRDAKQSLSEAVQSLPGTHGVFLDCLTLPRGVVNRSFIYGSLARAERIILVETENFQESDWCRKEAWFAHELAAQGLTKADHLKLPDTLTQVGVAGSSSCRQIGSRGFKYGIASRLLKDIDYWARKPNLYSLKEAGHPIECLAALQGMFDSAPSPKDPAWVRKIGHVVADTLSEVVRLAPQAEPFDLWSTALQYSLAAFGVSSSALSKMEIRRGVDQLNTVIKSLVSSNLNVNPVFKAHASSYLGLIAAAAAVDLAGFELDPRIIPALRIAIGLTGGIRDGLILLDVRQPGPLRTFHLQLVVMLVKANLGSVGIVQNAADAVHQDKVGSFRLEVLPCVTMYPGMQDPISPLTSSSIH